MSFFKKLTGSKNKTTYHFFFFIINVQNLPLRLEGDSLLAQIKRKDKTLQTKYAHVNEATVTWQQESMYFSTSLWSKGGVFDEKCFTIKIKSHAAQKDVMEFELDLSKFVKENSFLEHVHAIEFPPEFDFDSGVTYAHKNKSATKPPRMNLVIRSYADGLNHALGDDFSQFHESGGDFKNPLLQKNSTVSRVINEKLDTSRHYGDNDQDGLMPDPEDQRIPNKDRRGTRKISVMFNEVTSGEAPGGQQQQQRGSIMPKNDHRQSTYRFSIAAGQGVNAPLDSDEEQYTQTQNTFDDDDDPLFAGADTKPRQPRKHLMSVIPQQQNHFDIGEDSDYE